MNENIQSLVQNVGTDISGKWIGIDKLAPFAKDVIIECLKQIEIANSQHCAYTTFDLGIVHCAKEKITNHLKEHFNIKNIEVI
jgi:hypothetical protein